MSVNKGPQKPARINPKRERTQRSARRSEGTYTEMGAAKATFNTSVKAGRGGRDDGEMPTIAAKPSTRSNGGTQQYRIQRGRQNPL